LRWQAVYDAHDEEDGPPLDAASFAAEGLEIARAVKRQLPDWTVVYHDEKKFADHLADAGHRPRRPGAVADYRYEIEEGAGETPESAPQMRR
jgi:hypothetical protein